MKLHRGVVLLCGALVGCPDPPPPVGLPFSAPGTRGEPLAPRGDGVAAGGVAGAASMPTFDFPAGGGVPVSGTVVWEGATPAGVRLDVHTSAVPGQGTLRHATALDGAGPFTVEVPAGAGALTFVAFVDDGKNGPEPGEPGGVVTVEVGDQPVTGVELRLTIGGLGAFAADPRRTPAGLSAPAPGPGGSPRR